MSATANIAVATVVVGPATPSRAQILAELAGATALDDVAHLAKTAGIVVIVNDDIATLKTALTFARAERADLTLIAAVLGPQSVASNAQRRQALLAAGANDVLFWTAGGVELQHRVAELARLRSAEAANARSIDYSRALLQGTDIGVLSIDEPEPISELLGAYCDAIGWQRVALVMHDSDTGALLLISASDDPSPMKIPLDLKRYPELRTCVETRRPVLIEDSSKSELLGEWAPLAAKHGGQSIFCTPLMFEGKAVGVLLFRNNVVGPLPQNGETFLRLAAGQLLMMLRAGGVIDAIYAQTRRKSQRGYAEERRRRAIEQYRDFFDASSDSIVVVDAQGCFLHVNRAAEQLTGYASSGLLGRELLEIVAPAHREAMADVITQAATSAQLESFDLQLQTTSGERLVVNVASSNVLAEHSVVVFSFRDVTEARLLEAELRHTKDFLERVIDSAVDAIVAADLDGSIILFNQGASRLFGYAPEDVVGKRNVWSLYPDGIAKQVMSELRAAEGGGVGRLQPTRREIITKDDELVPVSLSAAIVYEGGREVATVGVLSDLRERLNMEERLQQAQEKLQQTEKQAVIAELAGVTAHELNQPLTSVMGYAELLKKKLKFDDPHLRSVDVILSEAERMAEIVRKIGSIVRYETKAYVGTTQILDLDKSAGATRDG